MDEPIEEVYFNWLYSKVASVDVPTPSNSYWTLLRDLHTTPFVWMVQGDDNRREDGLDVRREFHNQFHVDRNDPWMNIECSVLEMLIAFSRVAEFNSDLSARDWFWIFMRNLGLDELSDACCDITRQVSEVMDIFIWRTYRRNGRGGLFPIKRPEHDQRQVEIWYQFCEYLIDQER